MIPPALAIRCASVAHFATAHNRTRQTEADIVVPVVRLVPVAVRRAEVVWIVVPGTAAENAGDGVEQGPGRGDWQQTQTTGSEGYCYLPID